MDLNKMNVADLLKLCGSLGALNGGGCAKPATSGDSIPVLVCTDKRGVVFGYTPDANARPINLTDARMALYWSTDVGGVFGLADIGPTKGCKISATVPAITLEGVTAVFAVTDAAVKAWGKAPVQGR